MRNPIGPGFLITAAFIGPGTVTTASQAGASFGYTLLWALLFALIAALILQEMSARLGIIGQMGLSEALRQCIKPQIIRYTILSLAFAGIVVGNTAYEAGNLIGASLGLTDYIQLPVSIIGPAMALIAGAILWFSVNRHLELVLGSLVALMSICFISTAIISQPDWSIVVSKLFALEQPSDSLIIITALIGTTVVPYNLFLHSALAKSRWRQTQDLSHARWDLSIAILLGGIISMAILITAGSVFTPGSRINSASDMAHQLEPLLGQSAELIFSIGLTSAGLTSAITAPLAAAYTICGLLGQTINERSLLFRFTWCSILTLGALFSALSYKPTEAIILAQYANGLLLPIIALFLIYVVNQTTIMKKWRNNILQNTLAILVFLLVILLAFKSLGLLN